MCDVMCVRVGSASRRRPGSRQAHLSHLLLLFGCTYTLISPPTTKVFPSSSSLLFICFSFCVFALSSTRFHPSLVEKERKCLYVCVRLFFSVPRFADSKVISSLIVPFFSSSSFALAHFGNNLFYFFFLFRVRF